jgi:hypothetical protein
MNLLHLYYFGLLFACINHRYTTQNSRKNKHVDDLYNEQYYSIFGSVSSELQTPVVSG